MKHETKRNLWRVKIPMIETRSECMDCFGRSLLTRFGTSSICVNLADFKEERCIYDDSGAVP